MPILACFESSTYISCRVMISSDHEIPKWLGKMNLKRAIVTTLLIALLAGIIFTARNSTDFDHIECVVQSDQVVLNHYYKSVLRVSQSFSGNKVTSWKKGKLKPNVRLYSSVNIADQGPPNQWNDQYVLIYGKASESIFHGLLPVTCVKALQSILIS